ncbi:glycosyl transferase family 2 [Micractinium conductrix]|uniref:Glycosyltransferase family 92 protein n=1 Tax=Micractinium conductrix TaxID=554055 RepID=A0A2P6V069_9CHLO|nr:glycosyl transferase family 2 [Micractinium conductrix]|eukprot:PSC67481.1 glycosyl transferase family 2 [Micractinium conductrix]
MKARLALLLALGALLAAAATGEPGLPTVAICVAIKDQNVDVREWIIYHRAIGVRRFYIFDTGSKPPLLDAVQDFVQEGLVHVEVEAHARPKPGTHGPQVALYDRCLRRWARHHTFMAFIDTDEFLVLRDGTPTLPDLLKDYVAHGGLVVNWEVFGSGGLLVRPKGNSMMSYWRCSPPDHPENCHVKSIVRGACALEASTDPHHFFYKGIPDCAPVNSRHELVLGPKSKTPALERIALYHYAVKSLDDFQQKMARGSGMGNIKTIQFLEYVDNFTLSYCPDALDVGLQLSTLMALQSAL